MKWIIGLLMFLILTSCAHKVDVRAPKLIHEQRYSYVKGDDGRLYIVATSSKDFDEAMKTIKPGPATVDKVELWVITPLGPVKKQKR